MGKSGSVVENPEIKWFLQVWMAHSDAFQRCMLGGTSWKSMAYFFMDYFKSIEHSL